MTDGWTRVTETPPWPISRDWNWDAFAPPTLLRLEWSEETKTWQAVPIRLDATAIDPVYVRRALDAVDKVLAALKEQP